MEDASKSVESFSKKGKTPAASFYNETKEYMNKVEKSLKDFVEKASKNISNIKTSLKNNNTFKDVSKLFPKIKDPFKDIIKNVNKFKTTLNDVSKKIKMSMKESSKSVEGFSIKGESSIKMFAKKIKEYLDRGKILVKDFVKNISREMSFLKLSSNFNSVGNINKLFPDVQAPFGKISNGIKSLKGAGNDYSKSTIKDMSMAKSSVKGLASEGGAAIKSFAGITVSSITTIIAAVAALIVAGAGIYKFLSSLAKKDLEYEKLARQLWTTKENAKEIDMALKTMGVTMKDLWLSPELLKQFNQLRKDSAQLKLPKEYSENLKIVRDIGFEFQRLKQLGTLAFQWIGMYILKYAAGPLADIHQALHKFNDGLVSKIPSIAKVIGTALGIVFRVIVIIVETLGFAFNLIGKIFNFIGKLADKVSGPLKKIIEIIALIGVAIASGPVGAVIGLILVIDDLFTAIRGGKSVIGSVFGSLKDKAKSAYSSISNGYKNMKKSFHDRMKNIGSDWDYYWNKAKGVLEKLEDKAKKTWAKIKEWSKGIWDKAKDKATDLGSKVKDFSAKVSVNHSIPAGYLTSNNTSNSNSVSNSNNKNSTTNNINVYGSNAQATANAVSNKLTTGIGIRNMQGVY